MSGRKHMSPDERDLCIALYGGGATLDDLATVFDRERCTIQRLVQRRKAYKHKKGRYCNVDKRQLTG